MQLSYLETVYPFRFCVCLLGSVKAMAYLPTATVLYGLGHIFHIVYPMKFEDL